MILASALLALGLVAAEDVTVSTNKVCGGEIFEKLFLWFLSRGEYKENGWTMSLDSITTPSRESRTLNLR